MNKANKANSHTYDLHIETSTPMQTKELTTYIIEALLAYGKLQYSVHPANRVAHNIKVVTVTPLNKLGYKGHTSSS